MSGSWTLDRLPEDAPPRRETPVRPFYWSVRRELWEHRAIVVAPVIAAAVGLVGFLLTSWRLPSQMTKALEDTARRHSLIVMPYTAIVGLVLLSAFLVALFYSLDALHGERRDRSLFFWKSLPVSDVTTVLSKLVIPLAILPVISWVLIVTTQLLVILLSTAILAGNPTAVGMLWSHFPFVPMSVALLYGLLVISLWHAPIFGYLLFVSGWARRAPFLWAALPPLAIGAGEAIVFQSTHFFMFLRDRLTGWFPRAYASGFSEMDPLATISVGNFLAAPELWIGLLAAAAFVAAAVRGRRDLETG